MFWAQANVMAGVKEALMNVAVCIVGGSRWTLRLSCFSMSADTVVRLGPVDLTDRASGMLWSCQRVAMQTSNILSSSTTIVAFNISAMQRKVDAVNCDGNVNASAFCQCI